VDFFSDTDQDTERPAPSKAKARKKPRKVSRSSLMNSALYYLGRFSASRAGVKAVLQRRALRSLAEHGGDRDEADGWIEAVLDDLQRQGWLNDRAFAEARARSLWAQGTARRAIAMKLAAKGVGEDDLRHALEQLQDEAALISRNDDEDAPNPDLAAAVAYARRRRLGPWRLDPEQRTARRDKDLAALARRGFPLFIACQVLDADSIEDAEGLP
jgi:regulatory protein